MMKLSTWHRVKEVFLEALELPEDERQTFVDEACGGDDELLSEVRRLLAEDGATDLLPAAVPPIVDAPAEPAPPGLRIGRYEVVRELASGGMGTVYEAVQDSPRRTVALKTMRTGVGSPHLLRRFRFEAEALGRLRHPGIAQIFEAGTCSLPGSMGLQSPFFAMELVEDGRDLIAHAGEEGLDFAERALLFAEVCDAVHHGHQRGLIHRDLKPSNILVGADGYPKVIDFGVARAADADGANDRTRAGQVVGTLRYMSPEQVSGDPDAVDTRSDIYSLGVVLYELLSGRAPIEVDETPLVDSLRRVCEEEPPPLREHAPRCPDELAWIAGRALEKDPDHRYASAHDLAADLRRYVDDEPVEAGPRTAMYRLRKLMRRNRGKVAAAVAVLLALAAGLVVAERQRRGAIADRERAELAEAESAEKARLAEIARASEEEARELAEERRLEAETQEGIAREQARIARTQARIAEEARRFVDGMLRSADPFEGGEWDVSVREVVDRAAATVGTAFPDDPAVEAAVRTTLGTTYAALGLNDEAEVHLRRALAIADEIEDPDPDQRLQLRAMLASIDQSRGRFDEAGEELRSVLEDWEDRYGAEDARALECAVVLARLACEEGRLADAEVELRELVDTIRIAHGDEHELVPLAMNELAVLLERSGRSDEALDVYEEALGLATLAQGEHHPATVDLMGNLASLLHERGRVGEAEALNRRALAASERVLGPAHPDTLTTRANHAADLVALARYDEAREALEAVLDARTRLFGSEHRSTLATLHSLARLHQDRGRLDLAEELQRRAVDAQERLLGEGHEESLASRNDLGRIHYLRGRLDEAEACWSLLLERAVASVGETHRLAIVARANLGLAASQLGKRERAEELFRETIELGTPVFGESDREVLTARTNLASLLADTDRAEEAVAELEELFRIREEIGGPRAPETLQVLYTLARALERCGRGEEAEDANRRTVELAEEVYPEDHFFVAAANEQWAHVLSRLERPAEAVERMEVALAIYRAVYGDEDGITRGAGTSLLLFCRAAELDERASELEAWLGIEETPEEDVVEGEGGDGDPGEDEDS